jgi:hypothetical protein
MARGKKHTAEQIVNLLRQVEVGVANGKTLPQACKEAEIVEQTYYRWRREYGGLKVDQTIFFMACSGLTQGPPLSDQPGEPATVISKP